MALRPQREADQPSRLSRWLPSSLQAQLEEIDGRLERIPTRTNAYGFDPFGLEPSSLRSSMLTMSAFYRGYFRVETHGIEKVPEGSVLLIANHAGNTFAWDGAMLAAAMFFDAEPPRVVRGMAEFFLSTLPFFNVMMHRRGSVVGRPENCVRLLEQGEAIMVFPEGERGFVKTYDQAYELQRFGLGFMRLALETATPIVPIGIVGAEEQSPAVANLRPLGRLFGSPAFPITATFPWLGPLGFVPLPVKFRLHFGEPLRFEGEPGEEDAAIEERVEVVKAEIRRGIEAGLKARSSWFA
ncbi:MAG: lysophospholipid acyltransferase family protein [Myxococcota bacterium]